MHYLKNMILVALFLVATAISCRHSGETTEEIRSNVELKPRGTVKYKQTSQTNIASPGFVDTAQLPERRPDKPGLIFFGNNVLDTTARSENEIEFQDLHSGQPHNARYPYRHKVLDKGAPVTTAISEAAHLNLFPEKYFFRVRGKNYHGVWDDGYRFPFAAIIPWWQTWWLGILVAGVFIGMIFWIIRFVYAYQLQKKKLVLEKELAVHYERQRISSDLHDEIGSTLSSINIYSKLAKMEGCENPYLDSITANVNDVINKLDDLVWKINPKYDSLGSVITRLMFYAEPLAAAKDICVRLSMDESLKILRLNSEIKHQLFLILKELTNNAIKHANCKNIQFNFSLQEGILTSAVGDDGDGMNETPGENQRNGMKNISGRVRELNGMLHIESEYKQGVHIRLNIPVH